MATQRPTGVTILAVLQLIGSALTLLMGISVVFLGGIIFASGVVTETPEAGGGGAVISGLGMVALILGVIGLIAGYGLFALKGWGWWLAILWTVLNIIHGIVTFFQDGIVISILSLVISGLILYYLNKSNVKRAFGLA